MFKPSGNTPYDKMCTLHCLLYTVYVSKGGTAYNADDLEALRYTCLCLL